MRRTTWTVPRVVRPTLPADPYTNFSRVPVGDAPVQRVSWREAVRFANLLSAANGLRRY